MPSDLVACYCMAVKHDLWTNCIECGKILCSLEKEYEQCTFCRAKIPVEAKKSSKKSTEDTYRTKVNIHSNPSTQWTKDETVKEQSFPELALKQAEERKRMLLEFDRNDVSRSKIKDLAADFGSVDFDRWLTPEERAILKKREQMKQKANEAKKNRYTLDLMKRVLVEEKPPTDEPREEEEANFIIQKPQRIIDEGYEPVLGEGELRYIPTKDIKLQPRKGTRKMIVQDDLNFE